MRRSLFGKMGIFNGSVEKVQMLPPIYFRSNLPAVIGEYDALLLYLGLANFEGARLTGCETRFPNHDYSDAAADLPMQIVSSLDGDEPVASFSLLGRLIGLMVTLKYMNSRNMFAIDDACFWLCDPSDTTMIDMHTVSCEEDNRILIMQFLGTFKAYTSKILANNNPNAAELAKQLDEFSRILTPDQDYVIK